MTPASGGTGRRQRRKKGAHRKPRKRSGAHRKPPEGSVVTRTVAVGGAAVCLGVVYEMSAPVADALSIVIPANNSNGDTIQINILEGNVFDPQLGVQGGNVSNNTTVAQGAIGNGSSQVASDPSSGGGLLGAAAGNGNTIQINILSYNIFNPQVNLAGANVSNNTTISNVAAGKGNNSSTAMTSTNGFWTTWFGLMTGNGNTTQISYFSGNIINPQWSLFGQNISNNVAVSNVADNNGNNSTTGVTSGGFWGAALFGLMTGNGNTNQRAGYTTNIFNPQVSVLAGNQSSNAALTNDASGNGNNSNTDVKSAGGLGNLITTGATGNGNTSQNATGTGNIFNPQLSFGNGHPTVAPLSAALGASTNSTTGSAGAGLNQTVSAVTAGTDPPAGSALNQTMSALNAGTNSAAGSAGSFNSRIRAAVDQVLGLNRLTTSAAPGLVPNNHAAGSSTGAASSGTAHPGGTGSK